MTSLGAPSSFAAPSRSASSRRSSVRNVCGVEAGADLAAILQLAVDPFAERERREALPPLADMV